MHQCSTRLQVYVRSTQIYRCTFHTNLQVYGSTQVYRCTVPHMYGSTQVYRCTYVPHRSTGVRTFHTSLQVYGSTHVYRCMFQTQEYADSTPQVHGTDNMAATSPPLVLTPFPSHSDPTCVCFHNSLHTRLPVRRDKHKTTKWSGNNDPIRRGSRPQLHPGRFPLRPHSVSAHSQVTCSSTAFPSSDAEGNGAGVRGGGDKISVATSAPRGRVLPRCTGGTLPFSRHDASR
ncbi:hypothetical protein BaRGS_00038091 [Batillaria attramentaria]|uniref:Uncharacterized protein n=1 Tax=Batillaria attramentaria TaxID=370345 RepID=A0ABD0J6U6_9CAEN